MCRVLEGLEGYSEILLGFSTEVVVAGCCSGKILGEGLPNEV